MYELCYWDHVNHTNKAFFSWQIMFTSKSKNTHPHLEEMPSRFLCDLSGHICGQYRLACGQPSFYCFISALVRKDHCIGPKAASAHVHSHTCIRTGTYAHTVQKPVYTCICHCANTNVCILVKQHLACCLSGIFCVTVET